MEPLLSIIVSTYNQSEFVLENLNSIKTQTYKNIELIVCDDCSTDSTIEICRNWIENNKERFVRTKLITTSVNTGVPGNFNRGLKEANGEWIKVIASDDALVKDAVENVIKYLADNPDIELLFTQIELYHEKFLPENSLGIRPDNLDQASIYSNKATPEMQLEYILKGGYHFAPGFFMKKSILSEVGFYDETYTMTEDIPFFLKLALHGKKIHYAPVLTALYRQHKNNLTNKKDYVLPRYELQIYTALFNASKKYGKWKFIISHLWHKSIVKTIFLFGNRGFLLSALNWVRINLQPIRFYNLISKLIS